MKVSFGILLARRGCRTQRPTPAPQPAAPPLRRSRRAPCFDHTKTAEAFAKATPAHLRTSSSRAAIGRWPGRGAREGNRHVLDGAATFVTGGTMVGAVSRPGQWRQGHHRRGHHPVKGDMVIVLAGMHVPRASSQVTYSTSRW
jgi:hypothetical protein